MRRFLEGSVARLRNRRWLWFLLPVAVVVGCEELGFQRDEVPPARPRILNRPGWASPETLKGVGAGSGVEGPLAPEGTATPPPVTDYVGVVGKVLERFKSTERVSERQRSLDAALPEMTPKDVTEALRAIQSGKRLDAEVGMALITGFYTSKKEWSRIDEGYKQLFQSVPELRFEPGYLLEHAWTLMKMGQLQKSVDKSWEAEKNFHNLAPGQSTYEFRSRLLECRAWAYEGLFRESVSKGADDTEVALWRDRAVQAWEGYRDLQKPLAEKDKEAAKRLATAEDHLQGFKTAQ